MHLIQLTLVTEFDRMPITADGIVDLFLMTVIK
jgi:hypothetical protein